MQYRPDRYGKPLSVLGYGCMRFPQSGGKTDLAASEALVRAAVEGGVNYFDTAYIYPGNESALGEILSHDGLRDKVNIATKLPHFLVRRPEDMERLFQEELRRLKTDRVDYYLLHMLTDAGTWQRLCDLGMESWLEEKRRSGAVGQIGFSYHGNTDTFRTLLDRRDWDFCMIQYNYMDEHSQAGRRGLEYAHSKGLPVMIMEPLRGGKLVNRLPKEARALFDSAPERRSPAEWGLRWLWDQPEVCTVLSGMNTPEMLEENLRAAEGAVPGCMGAEEKELLRAVAAAINARMKVGCTGCRYCMPCPRGVDIPGTFSAWNRVGSEGWFAGLKDYLMCTGLRQSSAAASLCVGCGRCEAHCPQHIPIRQELKNARRVLEGVPYQVARRVIRLFRSY